MRLAILAACAPGEIRVAVTSQSTLIDYALWRPGLPDGVGDLHRGRITARVPAMAGAFVALDGPDGFLPDTEGAAGATVGTVLGVRITRAAQGGKGPRLSGMLDAADRALLAGGAQIAHGVMGGGVIAGGSITGGSIARGSIADGSITGGSITGGSISHGPPALIRRGPGPLVRLAALYPDAPVLLDDAGLAATLRPLLGTRLTLVRAAFDAQLEGRIEALADPLVDLPGGARLAIYPTPALTSIDVDAGAATAARADKGPAQFAFNRTILPALAAEIRLRNLSGAILVDLAGLPARRRAALGPALAAALADDPLRPRLLGFTRLGLAEIVRPRIHPPLHESLAGPHAAGLVALRQAALEIAANPSRALALRAAPPVVGALQADPVALDDLARRAGRRLVLRADPALAATAWVLEAVAT